MALAAALPPSQRSPLLVCLTAHTHCACRSLTELFAEDPECAKPKPGPGQAGLARTHTFAGAGLDDELELKKLQVGGLGVGAGRVQRLGAVQVGAALLQAERAAQRCSCAQRLLQRLQNAMSLAWRALPPRLPRPPPPHLAYHPPPARCSCASGPA